MIKEKFIRDGNFTPFARGALCIVGITIGILGLKYFHSSILAIIGLTIAAVGGYASRAAMLKLKPFDNSYRKVKSTYNKVEGESEKKGQ